MRIDEKECGYKRMKVRGAFEKEKSLMQRL